VLRVLQLRTWPWTFVSVFKSLVPTTILNNNNLLLALNPFYKSSLWNVYAVFFVGGVWEWQCFTIFSVDMQLNTQSINQFYEIQDNMSNWRRSYWLMFYNVIVNRITYLSSGAIQADSLRETASTCSSSPT